MEMFRSKTRVRQKPKKMVKPMQLTMKGTENAAK
jgi:hypothetical protein